MHKKCAKGVLCTLHDRVGRTVPTVCYEQCANRAVLGGLTSRDISERVVPKVCYAHFRGEGFGLGRNGRGALYIDIGTVNRIH